VMRRGRARLLDAAAEMREQAAAPAPVFRLRWSKLHWNGRSARLATVTVLILAFMVTGGTGLVSASNGALPGDRLYPVKRGWEDLRLFFAFDPLDRESLENEYEDERMEEIGELFSLGRESDVDFYGFITAQTDTGWIVSQVIVQITPQTRIDGILTVGAFVEVEGATDVGGVIVADRVRVHQGFELDEDDDDKGKEFGLPSPPQTPTSTPKPDSNGPSDTHTPKPQDTETPEPTRTPESSKFEFEGVLQTMNGKTWRISGQNVNVTGAEIDGTPYIGALVRVKGIISSGVWLASEVDIRSSGGDSSPSSSGGDEGSGGGDGGHGSMSTPTSSPTKDDDHSGSGSGSGSGGSSSSSSSESNDD